MNFFGLVQYENDRIRTNSQVFRVHMQNVYVLIRELVRSVRNLMNIVSISFTDRKKMMNERKIGKDKRGWNSTHKGSNFEFLNNIYQKICSNIDR